MPKTEIVSNREDPRTLTPEPKRAKLRSDKQEPKLTCSATLIAEETRAYPKIDMFDPTWISDRTEMLDDICMQSIMEVCALILAYFPNRESDEPSRMLDLKLMEEPIDTKERTDIAEELRQKERKDMEEPN
jgi:hypothetical protein